MHVDPRGVWIQEHADIAWNDINTYSNEVEIENTGQKSHLITRLLNST